MRYALHEAFRIVEDEATEDAEKQGGSEPLDVPYLSASPWLLWRKRIVWLLVLFVAEAYTGTVLRAFEDELEAVRAAVSCATPRRLIGWHRLGPPG